MPLTRPHVFQGFFFLVAVLLLLLLLRKGRKGKEKTGGPTEKEKRHGSLRLCFFSWARNKEGLHSFLFSPGFWGIYAGLRRRENETKRQVEAGKLGRSMICTLLVLRNLAPRQIEPMGGPSNRAMRD